jgi:hypothetical protein
VGKINRGGVGKIITRSQLERERANRYSTDHPLIVLPDGEDQTNAIMNNELCCACRHFDRELGQQEMKKQRFVERILLEEKYRKEWFSEFFLYGMCHIFDFRLIDPYCPAVCMASDLDSTLVKGSTEALRKVKCPHYESKEIRGQRFHFSRTSSGKMDL